MSDPVQLALIASVAPTVAALAALVIGIRTSRKADKIITATDGNLTALRTEMAVDRKEIEGLKRILQERVDAKIIADDVARLLAEAAAKKILSDTKGGQR